jgi:hypothetical protein
MADMTKAMGDVRRSMDRAKAGGYTVADHTTDAMYEALRLGAIDPRAAAAMMAGSAGVAVQSTGSRSKTYQSPELEEMLRMRTRSAPDSRFPHWHAYKHDEKVFVTVVTSDGNAVTLEDEWPLFPSDALVTKLRLLEK